MLAWALIEVPWKTQLGWSLSPIPASDVSTAFESLPPLERIGALALGALVMTTLSVTVILLSQALQYEPGSACSSACPRAFMHMA